ncbi:MAG: mandelate racemase [Rhodospirillaceae bacterium]|jgi:L-alanine-DL-glutamate epimerase-like enolase superfamily enzyme|nr:mandelate racemase [Rhodospirillaceae bacterium]MBT3495373.1 mandelate racemase [Rhodospirillaceae bacterium]MBT3778770.1 mandelate racemase [Rhodospirillaceae bacterium]MBT3975584.1 mandelate racemase [Rhodospirillaceae bacterium]MBT4170502.1 mandelate racemase [Rhodospirillaceae bacterium]
MRITDIREATAAIGSEMSNAYVDFSQMTISVVAVESDTFRNGKAVTGYGFCSNGRYAQGGILRERLIPRIQAAAAADLLDESGQNFDPRQIRKIMLTNEKPGGHGDRAVAASAVDMAVWDLLAKLEEKPLWRVLSERYSGGDHDARVLVYPGGGYYYPGKGLQRLREEMRGYHDQGYKAVKMKIGAAPLAEDLARIEAVIDEVGSGGDLAVDANGRFDLDTALAYGDAMQDYGLFWFEEPGDPLDYSLNAELTAAYSGAIATGENLFSLQDARNLARHGGMRPDIDWLQFDPALCYGLTEYLDILEVLEGLGWPRRRHIPHGGHQLALAMAAGLQLGGSESYPGVFQPFGGFADDTVVEGGRAEPGEHIGIGMEAKTAMFSEIQRLVGA